MYKPVRLTVLFDEITTHDEPAPVPLISMLLNDTSALVISKMVPEDGALMITSGMSLAVMKVNDLLTPIVAAAWYVPWKIMMTSPALAWLTARLIVAHGALVFKQLLEESMPFVAT